MRKTTNIGDFPALIDAVNAILNNGGIAEIRHEKWKDGKTRLLVVEQSRSVKLVQENIIKDSAVV